MTLIRKRKLTDQQTRRMADQQAKREKAVVAEDATLSASIQGRIISHYGRQIEVVGLEGEYEGQIWRCHVRTNLQALVTGDNVIWQADTQNAIGVIIAQHPRSNVLNRPDRYGKIKPVVANIDVLVLVFAPNPISAVLLLDKYIIAAELAGIDIHILLNKTDLCTDDTYHKLLQEYKQLGYTVYEYGLDADPQDLHDAFRGKTISMVGQSGVGKSTIINTLVPEAMQKTKMVSENSQLGQHTTTSSRYLPLPEGGAIIDSPGIREFGLWHMSPDQVQQGFVEMKHYYGKCQFRNCLHTHPKGCAVHIAASEGKILPRRLDSMIRLTTEAIEVAEKYL